ncbi:hypothetical protein [[Acidovorax] ebreus]|uniref:hypothetical protein n=1 Tax=Diaphorobacter sp. LI3 TaxID=2952886 RepID=UPI00205D8B50|nr:hypothetical protein MRB47_06990 [Diaphorobacter sp. LI3]
MALTMTRTRTQTALTQLVETLANLKGELAFVEAWLAEPEVPAELSARGEVLRAQMEALATTLQVFDPGLDVGQVAAADGWAREFGCKRMSTKALRNRYFAGAPARRS